MGPKPHRSRPWRKPFNAHFYQDSGPRAAPRRGSALHEYKRPAQGPARRRDPGELSRRLRGPSALGDPSCHKPGTGDSWKHTRGPEPPCRGGERHQHYRSSQTISIQGPVLGLQYMAPLATRRPVPSSTYGDTGSPGSAPHPTWGGGAPCSGDCRASPYFFSSLPPWGGSIPSDHRPPAGLCHVPLPNSGRYHQCERQSHVLGGPQPSKCRP